jgi:hypothetical protein
LLGSLDQCRFWQWCFAFLPSDSFAWMHNAITASNQNLSLTQKEVLLWHQWLSHARLATVHNLCC